MQCQLVSNYLIKDKVFECKQTLITFLQHSIQQIVLPTSFSTAIDYDEEARYAFIGDYSGQITVCSIDANGGVHFINALKGHNGSIQSLCWDGSKGWLYSGNEFLFDT